MRRSPERTEFLADVLTTAVEGGINYWAQVSDYKNECDFPVAETSVVVYDVEDDPDNENPEGIPVNIEKIASAIRRILNPEDDCGIGPRVTATIREANAQNDAGLIDADDADCIMQVAALGRCIYG